MAFNHEERALRNVELLNANSGLQNDLEDERAKLAAVTAQLHVLQSQLTSTQTAQGERSDDEEDTLMEMRGGGGCSSESSYTGESAPASEFPDITVRRNQLSNTIHLSRGICQGNGTSPGAYVSLAQMRGGGRGAPDRSHTMEAVAATEVPNNITRTRKTSTPAMECVPDREVRGEE